MNTDPKKKIPNRLLNAILKRRWAQVLAVLLLVLVVWLASWIIWPRQDNELAGATIFVSRGPLRISVTESGTIKNRDQVVVKSQVEGRTTILTLIPEGTYVKEGDLLIELDASGLEDQKTKQEITVLNAEASFVRATENLAVTKSQGESDLADAELDCEFAKLDLEKYLKGEYPQQVDQLDAEITIAKQELTQAQERLGWSEKLAAAGYITASELKSDELDETRKELDLKLAEGKLDLLENYTKKRDIRQLESDVEQAAKALERVRRRVNADNIQADADLKAKDAEFKRQQAILDKIGDQIAKCQIRAPVGGMVVYATTGQGSWRGNVEPLEEGQEVRERQELIHLPTTSSMMAEIKVHESSLRKIQSGMHVDITIDALPGRAFSGHVGKIGLLPDAQSAWLNPDLKVYSTEIYLDGDASGIRTGMTCRAEIIVQDYQDAIYVPVQSIMRVAGVPTAYVVGPNGPKPRAVELGLDNNRMVRIISGLKEGEEILLAPPLSPSEIPQAQQDRPSSPTVEGSGDTQPTQTQSIQPASEDIPDSRQSNPVSQFDPEKLRTMSPEERRKLFESLTAEQREQLRRLGGQQRRPRSTEPSNGPAESK